MFVGVVGRHEPWWEFEESAFYYLRHMYASY